MDSFYPERLSTGQISCTAGAVPVRNEKGEVSMQKVKVQRYIPGKRPDYAPHSSDEGSSDEELMVKGERRRRRRRREMQRRKGEEVGGEDDDEEGEDEDDEDKERVDEDDDDEDKMEVEDEVKKDDDEEEEEDKAKEETNPRLRRILAMRKQLEHDKEERLQRHKAEVIEGDEEGEEGEESEVSSMDGEDVGEGDEDDEVDDDVLERRRALIRERVLALQRQKEDEVLAKVDDKDESSSSEESESEYEEYTDSEEDTGQGARLKPVFVRKRDRITIKEKEEEVEKQKRLDQEERRRAEQRKRESARMVDDSIRAERLAEVSASMAAGLHGVVGGEIEHYVEQVDTDDDDPEAEYEAWKVRELKRVRREREEREAREREREEVERLRNLTEEERRAELRSNPKLVTNMSEKGKYKFLQKYYHRGAFYLDKDENVLKRDVTRPTLEDHFDKTVLPKVMQVKNFGRSGRTKYTHLVDQDTTHFESAWTTESKITSKFTELGGGMKQSFEKPTKRKKLA